MGARALFINRHFSACQAKFPIKKVRVVTEAASAAGCVDDRAIPAAFRDDWFGVTLTHYEGKQCGVVCAAICDTLQIRDQLCVIVDVTFMLSGVIR